jgi:hypothetical protein
MDNLPFSFVEKERTCSNTRLKPITRIGLAKFLENSTVKVEGVIKKKLKESNQISVVIDGWSDTDSTHYIGMFALAKCSLFLLAFSIYTKNIVFELNGCQRCIFLIADNENTNKSVSSLISVPLIS